MLQATWLPEGGAHGSRICLKNFHMIIKQMKAWIWTVCLEAVAPMTINKIETLLMEWLRMQSGMLAPSYIHPQYTKMPAFGGRRANLRGFPTLIEGFAKLKLEGTVEIGNDVDGLMGLSMTLDQWLRQDAGIIEDQNL